MRISGTEPSSVIFAKESCLNVEKWCHKSAKTRWSQKEWCNKPTKLQFESILKTENLYALKNDTNQTESTAELGYMP